MTSARPCRSVRTLMGSAVIVLVLALLVLPASTPAAGQEQPDVGGLVEAPDCFGLDADTALDELRTLRDVTCHQLSVPLHHDQPDGPQAQLAVAVLHAVGEPTGPPILQLAGGPGGAGIIPGLVIYGLFGDVTLGAEGLTRDVILLDQRGTGYSTPNLDCPEVGTGLVPGSSWQTPPDAPWTDLLPATGPTFAQDPGSDPFIDAVRACHDRLAATTDLNAFTTIANATDLESLRLALGHDQLVLHGTSYGTKLALRAAALFPDSWASLVIDSPVPGDANFMAEIAAGYDEALANTAAACAADPRCPFDDIVDRASARVLELAEAPVTVGVVDATTGAPLTTTLTPTLVASSMYQLHYLDAALVPPLLDGIATGQDRGWAFSLATRADAVPLIEAGVTGAQDTAPQPQAFGMLLSFLCAEEFAQTDPDAYVQSLLDASPLAAAFGAAPFFGSLTLEICAEWPVAPADPSTFDPVSSDIPTLVVTGAFDQITPASYGPRTVEGLSASQLVEVPDGVHSPLAGLLECGGQLLSAFITDPAAPVDATCATERVPTFDAYLPDAPTLGAERVAGGDRYQTAAATSRFTFPQGVPTAVVASGEDFADALVGGALAGARGVPLLLTASEELPEATAIELARLQLAEVLLIGGTAAVDDAVATAIGEAAGAPVRRIGGEGRAETAALVAQELPAAPAQVWLATGGDFPDALAAGAAAAGSPTGEPVLLAGQELPPATAAALELLQPDVITVVGGEAVVPQEVADAASAAAGGAEVRRLAGPDRYSTAAAVAATAPVTGSRIAVVAVTGTDFPDALAATPLAARRAPLVLLPPDGTSDPALDVVAGRFGSVIAIGGSDALSDVAVITLTAALPPILGAGVS